MKKNLGMFFGLPLRGVGITLVAFCVLTSNLAFGGLVAEWEFNSYGGGTPSGVTADHGTQTGSATLNGSITGSLGTMSSTAGTTLNSADSTAGNAIVLVGSPISGTVADTLTFHVSGTGLSGFVVTYATKDPNSPTEAQHWYYSTDGSSYTLATSVTPTTSSSYGLETIDFSGDTALNGAANVYFQLQLSDSANYSPAFDNFAFSASAVPEVPMTGLVMGFGVLAIAVGGTLRRKLRPALSSIA